MVCKGILVYENMVKVGITLGIGVDIVKRSRFKRLLSKNPAFSVRLTQRILHPIHEAHRFKNMNNERQVQYIAGSWAAKEAVFKTLTPNEQEQFNFNDWYRYHDNNGKPFIWNDNFKVENDEFHLSVSHDEDYIVATVLRQRLFDIEVL